MNRRRGIKGVLSSLMGGMVATLLSVAACGDDALVSHKYTKLSARFHYSPVSAVSQLYTACNSLGEWSTVRAVNAQYVFANASGETAVNRTAVGDYSGFYMGLCGFLVGLPSVPEVGNTISTVTCYDLACSNCYHTNHVTKRLALQSGGKAHCSTCQRTYDLNNLGQVATGEAGISLFRYRVYYGNNTLSINNF